ncbi:kinase-like domain-containing protein [Xylariaceae sp. FL0255]|nr:kinase-like domain-containing protein [Xylariaceae sp. FL0255]
MEPLSNDFAFLLATHIIDDADRDSTVDSQHQSQTLPPGSDCQHLEASRDRLLRELFKRSRTDLFYPYRRFVPRKAIREILTQSKVQSHLKLSIPNAPLLRELVVSIAPELCHCDELKNRYCTGKRVIFAILLRIGREDHIQHMKDDVCDNKLPLNAKDQSLAGLTRKQRKLFGNAQCQIRCHFLSNHHSDLDDCIKLDDGAVLPLIKRINIRTDAALIEPEREITKIEIYDDHYDLDRPHLGSNIFVLKTFKNHEEGRGDFIAELEANRRVPKHDEIVQLLMAFEYGSEFHLIFPFAASGDLRSLWRMQGEADPELYSPAWVLKQCWGIANALEAVHQPRTGENAATRVSQLHADINPSNILCFESDGGGAPTLKLSDFGCSRQVGPDGNIRVRDLEIHTKTYRPPEHDTEELICLRYDIWSLGCVYLDFVTWAIAGDNGYKKFARDRQSETDHKLASKGNTNEDTFFKKTARPPPFYKLSGLMLKRIKADEIEELENKNTRTLRSIHFSRGENEVRCEIKDTVNDHIRNLQNNSGPEFRGLLEIIQSRLLVIERHQRASSDELRMLLDDLVEERAS